MLLATAAGVAALGIETDDYIPVKRTLCWECHTADSRPLVEMVGAILPTETALSIGDSVQILAQLKNLWTADLIYIEPNLDLSAAPSLAFGGGPEPIDAIILGEIPLDASRPQEPQRGFIVLNIPDGMTRLVLELVPPDPDTTRGIDLAMVLYPGKSEPEGTGFTVDAAGRGGTERFELATAVDFLGYGYGNWTVEARLRLIDPDEPGPPPTTLRVPFQVHVDASSQGGVERTMKLPRTALVGPGQSALFVYELQANRLPAAGEHVTLHANVTSYHKHASGESGTDLQNMTRAFRLNVTTDGEKVHLRSSQVAAPTPPLETVSLDRLGEAVGYAAAFLLVSAIVSGGMFGKASRRGLNHLFGTAKRRVAFHNVLSYGLILAAITHTVMFLVEAFYDWRLGLIWGGLGILAMFGLGYTGAMQVPLIRSWSYASWRWTHYGMAVAAIGFTLLHILLDGNNFAFVQEAIGWSDPLGAEPGM